MAGGQELESAEGTTQGDPTAMDAYAIGILPFLALIKPETDQQNMKHVAYADDLAGGSKLQNLRNWWDKCPQFGPAIGYHPNAIKPWLIVKPGKMDEAKIIFQGTGVNITDKGKKYLGGFVGSKEGKNEYMRELVEEWLAELRELTKVAKSEPQAAYSGFTSGFKHKMTYFMRTIPNVNEILAHLDKVIDNEFIPAVTEGHVCSNDERKLLSLPVRMGGLGIPIFSETCSREFAASTRITEQLTESIVNQRVQLELDVNRQKQTESEIIKERSEHQQALLENLRTRMSKEQLRANDIAQMKGASAWLNALPLKDEGYSLTKREFYDAVSLRYRWPLKRIPNNCSCSKKPAFEPDHAMNCLTGGFIHRRHDGVRDIVAQMMKDVSYDVGTEPMLQPLSGETFPTSTNIDDEARVDIKARGFWGREEIAFFDVRVFNPFARSHMNTNLEALFRKNESDKKKEYAERVIRIEHGTFTPIVLSAYGGYGLETSKFISTLINKVADKHDLNVSVVANYIRTKLSFHLIRSQVLCIRGSRRLRAPCINVGDMEFVQGLSDIRT